MSTLAHSDDLTIEASIAERRHTPCEVSVDITRFATEIDTLFYQLAPILTDYH